MLLGDIMKRRLYYNPKGFYNLANQLFNDTNYKSEDRYRTTIGRYYYYIYLKIRDLILKSDKRPNIRWALSSSKGHGNLRTYLEELSEITNNNDFESIAEQIAHLHALRKKADYDTKMRIKSQYVEEAEKIVDEINNKLDRIEFSNKKGLKNIIDHLTMKEMSKKINNKKDDKKYLPTLDLD